MLATLSRWRPRVQIPSGPLRLGSSVGTSDRLKSDRSPVRPRPQPHPLGEGPDPVDRGLFVCAARCRPTGRAGDGRPSPTRTPQSRGRLCTPGPRRPGGFRVCGGGLAATRVTVAPDPEDRAREHRPAASTRNGKRCWWPPKYTAVCWALTEPPGGSQRPICPSADGSSGQDTAPPEDGLPRSTISPQVGIIAQRPIRVLNIVKTMPDVNIVSARISHDSTNGRSSAPSHQSTTAAMAKPPNRAYTAVNAVRSAGLRARACTLSWIAPDETDDHRGERDVEEREPARVAFLQRLDVLDPDVHPDRLADLHARFAQQLRHRRARGPGHVQLHAPAARPQDRELPLVLDRLHGFAVGAVPGQPQRGVQRLLHARGERLLLRGVERADHGGRDVPRRRLGHGRGVRACEQPGGRSDDEHQHDGGEER